MKNILILLGAVLLGALIIGGIGYGYIAYMESKLNASSKEYVDTVVPQIVTGWDNSKFDEFADQPALDEKGMTKEQMAIKFAKFKTLGALKEYKGSDGGATLTFDGTQKNVTANYRAMADFAQGPADILVFLSYNENQWKIAGFNVKSQIPSH